MPLTSSADVAALLDHAILQPTVATADAADELVGLRGIALASVCVKPTLVCLARELLPQTPTCTVIGFPHGSSTPEVKAFETERAFADGATEVDMVMNVGHVIGGDWPAFRADVEAVLSVVRARSGILKVIFETAYLTTDALKVQVSQELSALRVDFVKTSTGFGYVRTDDGHFTPRGATVHDVRLMRAAVAPGVGVKASGGVRTLDVALEMIEAGATRLGTTSTHAILREAAERFGG